MLRVIYRLCDVRADNLREERAVQAAKKLQRELEAAINEEDGDLMKVNKDCLPGSGFRASCELDYDPSVPAFPTPAGAERSMEREAQKLKTIRQSMNFDNLMTATAKQMASDENAAAPSPRISVQVDNFASHESAQNHELEDVIRARSYIHFILFTTVIFCLFDMCFIFYVVI